MLADQYLSASDFFIAVRSAASEAARTERQLEQMRVREGVRAQSYNAVSGGTRTDVNKTGQVIARLDFEDRMRDRLKCDYALIEEGTSVCYGEDNRGGIASLLGSEYADCLWFRYCAAEPWSVVATKVELSERQCRRLADIAVDMVDAHGYRTVIKGCGRAEA